MIGATTIDVKAYDLPDANGGSGPSKYPITEGTAVDLTSDLLWANGATVCLTKDGTVSPALYTIAAGSTSTTLNISPGLIVAHAAFNAIGLLTRNIVINFTNASANVNSTRGNIDAQITSTGPGSNGALIYTWNANENISFCGSCYYSTASVVTTFFRQSGLTNLVITDSFIGKCIIYIGGTTLISIVLSVTGSLGYAEGNIYILTGCSSLTNVNLTNCVFLYFSSIQYATAKDSVVNITNCLSHASPFTLSGYNGKVVATNCICQFINTANPYQYQPSYFTNCQFNYITTSVGASIGNFDTCIFNAATPVTGMGFNYGQIYAINCIFNRIPLGLFECSGKLINCTFNIAGVASTIDISQGFDLLLINCYLNGSIQGSFSGKNSITYIEKVVALNIGGVSGSHKSWLLQGSIASDFTTPYGPLSSTLKFTPTLSTYATYWDEQIYCAANKYIYIDVYIKKSVNSMSETPKIQLIDPIDMLLTCTPLSTITMTDDTNWQHFTISYKPTYSRYIYLRIRGANATGDWNAGYVVRGSGQIVNS
jgi:hypothetical protein